MSEIPPADQGREMVTEADLDKLRHMLGVSNRSPAGYRNYFLAGKADQPSMERLCAVGYVTKATHNYELSGYPCYHATLDGARAVGLKGLPE